MFSMDWYGVWKVLLRNIGMAKYASVAFLINNLDYIDIISGKETEEGRNIWRLSSLQSLFEASSAHTLLIQLVCS